MNKTYHTYISLPKDYVYKVMEKKMVGNNRDMAFKAGYRQMINTFPNNSLLYAIYIAGKEYVKVNTKRLIEIKNNEKTT